MFTKSLQGLANPKGDPKSSLEDHVARLSEFFEEIKINEGRAYDRIQSELSTITATMAQQMELTREWMTSRDETRMEGAAEEESAKETEV